MPKIILKFKDTVLKEFLLSNETVTIGRADDNMIKVDNLAVSGHHAKLFRENGEYVLIDLNSLNGTFVNGKKISKWILQHNDIITIGKHTLIYQDEKSFTRPPLFYPGGLDTVTPEGTVMIDSRTQKQLLEEAIYQKEGNKLGELVGALSIISGKKEDTEIELLKRITTIGKGKDAEIKLKGFFLPKISAVISRRPAGYFLSYSEGRAIPKVNGELVTGQVKLKDGDIIEIAKLKMQFFLKPAQE